MSKYRIKNSLQAYKNTINAHDLVISYYLFISSTNNWTKTGNESETYRILLNISFFNW